MGRQVPLLLGAHWIHFVWDFSLLRHFSHSVRRLARHLLCVGGMKFLATFLAFIILAQPAVSFGGQDVRSVAVQPLMDGNSDEASRELATALGDALRTSTRHHIVDSNVAANVTGYQGGEVGASPQLTEAETAADVGELMYGLLEYLYDQIEALASTNTPVNFTVKESVGASVSGTNIFVDVQHKIQSKRPATTAGMAAE